MERIFLRPSTTLLGFTSPPVPPVVRDVRASHHPQTHANAAVPAAETSSSPGTSRQPRMFFHSFKRIWPVGGGKLEEKEKEINAFASLIEEEEQEKENWVMKILRVRSVLPAEDRKPRRRISGERWEDGDEMLDEGDRCVGCDACFVDDDEEEDVKFDRESFSRLLRKVPLHQIRLFWKLSDLGSLAYVIGKLKVKT